MGRSEIIGCIRFFKNDMRLAHVLNRFQKSPVWIVLNNWKLARSKEITLTKKMFVTIKKIIEKSANMYQHFVRDVTCGTKYKR